MHKKSIARKPRKAWDILSFWRATLNIPDFQMSSEPVSFFREEEHINYFKSLAKLPDEINLVSPEDLKPDEVPKGYCVLYEYPFKIGFSWPFSPLVRAFLDVFDLTPGQLMPQFWWIVQVIDRLTAEWVVPFNVNDLLTAYSVRPDNYHRYSLFPRSKGDNVLILNTAVNDRGWKRQYVFLQVASVNDEDSQWLSSGWNESVINFSRVKPRRDYFDKVQRILNRSIIDRSFSPRSNDEGDEVVFVAEATSVEGSPREGDNIEEKEREEEKEEEREEMTEDAAIKLAAAKRAEQLELACQGREKARKRSSPSTGVDLRRVRGKQPRYSPKKTDDVTLSSLSGATLVKETAAGVELEGSTKATKDAPSTGVSGVEKPSVAPSSSSKGEGKNKEKVGEMIFKATLPADFMANDVLERDVIFTHLAKFLLPTFYDRYKESRVEDTGAHAAGLYFMAFQACLSFYAQTEGLRASFPDVKKRADEALEKEKVALEAVEVEKTKVKSLKVKLSEAQNEKVMYRDRVLELEALSTKLEVEKIKATTTAVASADEIAILKKRVEDLEGDMKDLEMENKKIEAFSRFTARAALMRRHLKGKDPMALASEELQAYLDNVGTEKDLDEDDDLEEGDVVGEVAAEETVVVQEQPDIPPS
ncbi:hypothetical protein L6452_01016 [Arctium lappa]|uniref:Uncharacterized protein n=1 Tax=Arctium lappa TaxID=4217 RepID=A0ACB9FGY3_ARCLA|nr:hypothetical protein L6452_01016 [Arctium lappa]